MASHYFMIRSRLNGLVLDIQGGSTTPGTRVITFNQKPPPNDNQLWYEDAGTGTIRSKLAPNLCLQPAGQGIGLVVKNYDPSDKKQQIALDGTTLHLRHNAKSAAEIQGANMAPSGKVVMGHCSGSPQQQWEKVFEGTPPAPQPAPPAMHQPAVAPPAMSPQPQVSGYFFIRSRLNPQLVCDINGDNASHGERVITYHLKHPPADNQLWYEDAATGTYRSKKNPNLCLAAAGDGTGMKVHMYDASNQKMKLQLSGFKLHLRSRPNTCMDIAGSNSSPGGKIVMHAAHGKANQQWEFVPCPQAGTPPGQGAYPAVAAFTAPPAVAPQPAVPQQRFTLRRSPGSPPPDSLPLGHQTNGGGQQWLGVAHTKWGDIPGKAQGTTCWYPYAGKEHTTNNFSWVCAPPGTTRLEQNRGAVPPNALQVGYQNDGAGPMYAIVASTPQGQIPGKGSAKAHAHYPFGGMEHGAGNFCWVVY